jgi:hypothetical protein
MVLNNFVVSRKEKSFAFTFLETTALLLSISKKKALLFAFSQIFFLGLKNFPRKTDLKN